MGTSKSNGSLAPGRITLPYDETDAMLNGDPTYSQCRPISTSNKSVEAFEASFEELDVFALAGG